MDMRTRDPYPIDFDDLVNTREGWIDRRIFWDEAIYELELKQIFARCWQFVAHDSQIPNCGDFLTTYIGEDGVIVSRHTDGKVYVYLNACPHRGNKICFADEGSAARRFTCNYHGWAFGTNGALLGVPSEHAYDDGDLDLSRWGPRQARVESYKGMIFANFDADAPSLDEYLGDYRWYLDAFLDNDEGGIEFLPGTIKSYASANWKFGVENFIGDAYHAWWTHDSGGRAMMGEGFPPYDPTDTYHASVNGHGWEFALEGFGDIAILGSQEVLDYYAALKPRMAERIGELRSRLFGSLASAAMFPNMTFLPGIHTFRTWLPRGPRKLELRIWTVVNNNMPDEIKQAINKACMMTFSPAGLLEMDDGENWEGNTRTNAGYLSRHEKLH
ncbi:MAG: Rieske 2Fe-2S domain-containing protein, partial [Pseudomonadota bacterium]|nr:Rieske 2Fe-2S domain-containing protein [Pseudomonadota bacterium]